MDTDEKIKKPRKKRARKEVPINKPNNKNLLREINESQNRFDTLMKKLVEKGVNIEEIPNRDMEGHVMQSLTPILVEMIVAMVQRYAGGGQWRGYTWNDDMQSEAILNLCRVALKFDINKSQNPFAYYTQIAKRAFLSVIEKEKKQRSIKDDIIEDLNDSRIQPSTTRQAINDMKQRQEQFTSRGLPVPQELLTENKFQPFRRRKKLKGKPLVRTPGDIEKWIKENPDKYTKL